MAKARARTATRKVKDKWKAKQWYTLLAPASFNKVPIAETPCDEPEKLIGRIATTTMQDLTGDFKLMHVKLDFQVETVNGTQANCRFIGHALTSDYLRRLARRNHTKINLVLDVTTKDGALIRVKPVAVTDHRSQSSQQTRMRKLMSDAVVETAANLSLGNFIKEMLDGRLGNKLFKACKPIYPVRKVEINKSEVRQAPTITLDDLEPTPSETPAAPAEGETVPPPVLTEEEGGPAPETVEVAPEKTQ